MMPTKEERKLGKFHYEFFGAPGCFLLTYVLPFVPLIAWTSIMKFESQLFVKELWNVYRWPEYFKELFAPEWIDLGLYCGWWLFQGIMYLFLPGYIFQARETQDKVDSDIKLKYKMNGLLSFVITFVSWYLLGYYGLLPMSIWADRIGKIYFVVQIWSYFLSAYLYIRGRWLAYADSWDNPYFTNTFLYDFWMGLELNPRDFSEKWDWKYFCECRPGLTFWVLLNFSIAVQQYNKYGFMTVPMILVCLFHFWYIFDCFYFEPALANTLDIYYERFGHMLVFGDLVWVPFTYVFQAAKIVDNSPDMQWYTVVFLILLQLGGYILFRGANWQKHLFRMYPETYGNREEPFWKTLTFAKGKRTLLIGGFWKHARHLNYAGDLMMGLAWCMCAGWDRLLPYYYIIYFTILLLHRRWRDEVRCRMKYGKDWEKYTKLVPWKIFPYVY